MNTTARHHTADFQGVEVPEPGSLQINSGEVHLWWSRLDRPPLDRSDLSAALTPMEIMDAQRQRQIFDRRRKTLSRGLLRLLVAGYLGDPAKSYRFERTELGKPFLTRPHTLRFSVSHSAFGLLMAFADNFPVGVDVEAMGEVSNQAALLRRCFSEREAGAIRALPAAERSHAIKTAWTRKEALLKAQAAGVFRGMAKVEVSHDLPATRIDESGWMLLHLQPDKHYVGALAVKTRKLRVTGYSLSEF